METLPSDLLFDLLLYLKNSHLLNLCNVNKQFYTFCDESNEQFWRQKVLIDYQERNIPDKPNNISWKEYYIRLGTNYFKEVPIFYGNDLIGHIWISRDDTTNNILYNSNRLFKSVYPNENPLELTNELMNSDEDLYWKNPLNEQLHNDKFLSLDTYNLTNRLIYSRFMSRASFARAFDVFRNAMNYQ